MRQFIYSLMCSGLVLVTGCPGAAPGNNGGGDDQVEPDAGPDAPPADLGQQMTGKTMDYFTPATPMDTVTLTSDGVDPVMTTISAVGGLYTIEGVPTGSKIYFTATRALYRPTRNPPVTIEGMPVMQDLHLMTVVEVARQYSTTNNLLVAGKAFVAAELKTPDGMPLDALPLANITLVDAADVIVPGTKIYAFGVTDLDPDALVTGIAGGTSRVGILDVPPGNFTLKVTYPDGLGVDQTMTVPVSTIADGATLVVTGGTGGPGATPPPANPTFAAHIYPRLQKASAGGLGCANCHTLGGTAGGVLRFDDPADVTLASMVARPGVIDLVAPALSLFLTKPLYEPPPVNHPNATFIDINDPDYKLFLLWITQGALP